MNPFFLHNYFISSTISIEDKGESIMKKNAFTFAELLGVIVLLGLIALITTPVILNAIEESKKNTFTFVTDSIAYLVDEYYETKKNELGFAFEGEFFDVSDENIRKKLKFPDSSIHDGNIYLTSDGEVMMYLTDGSWCASKEKESSKILITKGVDCVTNNILKKEFVDIVEKNYHSFKVQVKSPKNQTFTKYEFQVNDGEWIDNGTSNEYNYAVSKSGMYVVKARLTNSSSEVIKTNTRTIEIEKIKVPVFRVSPSGDVWASSKNVTIESYDNLSIYYSFDNTTYTEYTTTLNFTSNKSIYAYVTDGVVNSDVVTYHVIKIDTVVPTIEKLEQTDTSLIIKASDSDSGIAGYCINVENTSSNCTWAYFISNTYQYSKADINAGTNYVFVKDKAGNISTGKTIEITN